MFLFSCGDAQIGCESARACVAVADRFLCVQRIEKDATASSFPFGKLRNEDIIGLERRLDVSAHKRSRNLMLAALSDHMERRAADRPWILRSQMVEDGLLQDRHRESSGLICPTCNTTLPVSIAGTDSPSLVAANALIKMPRQLPASFSKAMGRAQANNNEFYNKTAKTWKRKENYVPLSERQSSEWDLRLDLTTELTATSIVEAAKAHKSEILWGLVSGVEYGKSRQDRPTHGSWLADADAYHVHIAVIFNKKVNRDEALKTFREHKVGGEYAVPRDQKHTYAGWRMHHRKAATKIDDTPHLWEYGTFPIDQLTDENGAKVLSMRRLYGRAEDDQMFQVLLEIGRRVKAKYQSERKRKDRDELEELRAEVKRLRESIEQ